MAFYVVIFDPSYTSYLALHVLSPSSLVQAHRLLPVGTICAASPSNAEKSAEITKVAKTINYGAVSFLITDSAYMAVYVVVFVSFFTSVMWFIPICV